MTIFCNGVQYNTVYTTIQYSTLVSLRVHLEHSLQLLCHQPICSANLSICQCIEAMQLIRVSSYLGKSSLARSTSCSSNKARVLPTIAIAKEFLSLCPSGTVIYPTSRRCFSSNEFRCLETRTAFLQSTCRTSALLSCMHTTRLLSTQAAAAATKETMEFKAETRKLLDIVTNSIYTDKEVFIRELISNASDALEKYRYQQVKGQVGGAGSVSSPLEINLFTDDKKNTLTIVDNGIGMSKEELVSNLGTIARSGSKQFVDSLRSGGEQTGTQTATEGIIGQFGVGFYSSFMVSDSVEVESLPAASTDSEQQQFVHLWKSDGSGTFEIESRPVEDCSIHSLTDFSSHHGSKITMLLKESCNEYADPEKIKR